MNKGKKILFGFGVLVLMFLSFLAGSIAVTKNDIIREIVTREAVYTGQVLGKHSLDNGGMGRDVDFDLFWRAWDALEEQYVDKEKLNEKKMFYGAVKGMVAALDDPYTVFMDPKIAEDFSNDLAGTFEGIGAEIGIKDDVLTVIAPLPDMPAEKEGLRAGDKILAIDQASTQGMSVDEAITKIRGPKDTAVVLSILRDDFDEIRDFTITRDKIVVKSIRVETPEDGIIRITIANFNDDTVGLFGEAVRKAIDDDPRGLILDLRNNPGGYLDSAIEVASEWVEEGVIVTEQYGDGQKNEHLARGRARLKVFPTVVLVNEGSASASEIVAGALKDHGLARIVGQKTFGKGSVQTLTDFEDGSSIKITVAKWLTPSGSSINDQGVEPDEIVDYTTEDYTAGRDPQLERAVGILTGEAAPTPEDSPATSSDKSLE
ncbi:MAG: S41 family peptidase [Candidatus Falkowbacteria bacterium]